MTQSSPDAAAILSEALNLIDERLADLRKANDVFRGMDWDKSSDIQRNDREIRWLSNLCTVLHIPNPAQRPQEGECQSSACERDIKALMDRCGDMFEEIERLRGAGVEQDIIRTYDPTIPYVDKLRRK